MKAHVARGVIGTALVALTLSGMLTGCSRSLTESECRQMLDHYTDKLIDQSRPSLKALERQHLIEQARQKAALDAEFLSCPTRVRRGQFECAMAANDADTIERCMMP